MSEGLEFEDLIRNPEQIMRAQQEQMAKAEELQRRMGEVVGEASSEDERISVRFSEADGLRQLDIDARAMRAGSDELAEQIMRVVNQARQHAQEQSAELIQEVFGGDAPDPHKVLEQVPDFERSMNEIMEDTQKMGDELTTIVERMRRMAES